MAGGWEEEASEQGVAGCVKVARVEVAGCVGVARVEVAGCVEVAGWVEK